MFKISVNPKHYCTDEKVGDVEFAFAYLPYAAFCVFSFVKANEPQFLSLNSKSHLIFTANPSLEAFTTFMIFRLCNSKLVSITIALQIRYKGT